MDRVVALDVVDVTRQRDRNRATGSPHDGTQVGLQTSPSELFRCAEAIACSAASVRRNTSNGEHQDVEQCLLDPQRIAGLTDELDKDEPRVEVDGHDAEADDQRRPFRQCLADTRPVNEGNEPRRDAGKR